MSEQENDLAQPLVFESNNSVDNSEESQRQKAPVFFIEKAMGWRIYFDRVLGDAELLNKLSKINYSEKEIKDTHTSLKSLIESLELYHINMERRKGITQAKNEAVDELHKTYMYHRTVVTNLFNLPEEVMGSMRINERTTRKEALWLRNVKSFYTQLLQNETALQKLSALSITSNSLKAHLKTLESIEKMIADRDAINTELQNITVDNTEKKIAFNNWLSTFRKVTRRAFADDKEVLIKLGL